MEIVAPGSGESASRWERTVILQIGNGFLLGPANLNSPSAEFNCESGGFLHDPAVRVSDQRRQRSMMDLKRKLALAGVGVLGVAGAGVGVAAAQTTPSSSTPPPSPSVTAPAPNVQDTTTPDAPGAAEKPETPGTEAPEKAGAEKAGAEKAGAEEPGDANLPGGGHADPPGQNVDHQFEGVE
jgi:hypothetical protein